jgi:DNA-binding SARP family transcriptional activator
VEEIPALRVGLLGTFSCSAGGRPVDLGGPRQRAVLVLLVLARGEVVPRERIAEALWGDRLPADPDGAVQAYVSHLRRGLSPGSAARTRSQVIVREGRGYAVRLAADAVDAWRFEALLQQAADADHPTAAAVLEQALGLWRGPALGDYADAPWAEAEIARLTELRRVARERLLAARLQLGEAALLVPDLEAMVAEEPLREERWRLLALALYLADRQADALAALRRARATLADELGVDPGPALRRLEQDVLAHSPALRIPRQRTRSAPVTEATRPATHSGDDLLDRDRELAAIRAALDDLAAGEPRLLLVEGPPGVGKTRLLTEARRLAAARGVRVLAARGSPLERAFGFGAVRQLFEPELLDAERRGRLLDGAAAGARGVFEPAGELLPDGSFAVLHGLYWLTVNLTAGGPVLLAVDDVQWCDGASLRFLAFLVRRLQAVPVLVVGTVRTGEQDVDDALLGELALEPTAVVVRPTTLSAEATRAMVAHRLGEPVSPLFATACHRATSGNPLLLRQLLRALEADAVRPDAAHADLVVAVGSRAVSSLVLMRLRRLPPEVLPVARAAAVLGDGAPLPVVAALAGQPEAVTASALAALARAEIVKDEWPFAFVHPLVREGVYRDLPAAERALLHERAAALLGDAAAPEEQVATHLLLAPRRGAPDTVAALRRAARTAGDRGACDSAVVLLRRALEEPPAAAVRGEVLRELGLVESLVDGAAGAGHLLEAYGLLDDARVRADLAVVIARTQVFAGTRGVATAFAREAGSVLPPQLGDQRQALLALERISGFMHGLDPAIWAATAPPAPVGDGDGARMLAATLAFEAALDGSDRTRALELARFALDQGRLQQVDSGLFWILAALVRMLGDDELGDFWDRARAQAHARGSVLDVHAANQWRGFWHWRRGELAEALASLRVALDQGQIWGHGDMGGSYTHAFRIACHIDQGDLTAAREVADTGLAGPLLGEGARLLQHAVARLLVLEGRAAEALALLDAIPAPVPVRNPAWNPWRGTAAVALHRLGRTGEAVRRAEEEVELLRGWGAATYLGPALVRLGTLRGDAGVPELREAVALLTPTTAAVDLARARCALGASPLVADEEAVPLLRAAGEAAHALGAAGVQERACAALAARGRAENFSGVAVRRPTAVERRVHELAARGTPIAEIAQQLFLTPGTVHAMLDGGGEAGGLKFSSSSPTEPVRHDSSERGAR